MGYMRIKKKINHHLIEISFTPFLTVIFFQYVFMFIVLYHLVTCDFWCDAFLCLAGGAVTGVSVNAHYELSALPGQHWLYIHLPCGVPVNVQDFADQTRFLSQASSFLLPHTRLLVLLNDLSLLGTFLSF